jgi:hypothetical protein
MNLSPYSTEARLDRIEQLLTDLVSEFRASRAQLQIQQERMMAEINDLLTAVAEVKTVQDGAVLAIHTLLDRVNAIVQSATDLAALKAAVAAEVAVVRGNAVPLAEAIAEVPPA